MTADGYLYDTAPLSGTNYWVQANALYREEHPEEDL